MAINRAPQFSSLKQIKQAQLTFDPQNDGDGVWSVRMSVDSNAGGVFFHKRNDELVTAGLTQMESDQLDKLLSKVRHILVREANLHDSADQSTIDAEYTKKPIRAKVLQLADAACDAAALTAPKKAAVLQALADMLLTA